MTVVLNQLHFLIIGDSIEKLLVAASIYSNLSSLDYSE